MKNVLYITYGEDLSIESSGVSKKIYSQVETIDKKNFNVYLSGFFNGKYGVKGDDDYIDIKNIPFLLKKKKVFKYLLNKIELLKIDIVYIRMICASSSTIEFYKKLKIKNIKIIMEIPTYPYDNEAIELKSKIVNFFDKIYRKKYINILDYIVTFSDHKYIYGVECINISNAVNSNEILNPENINSNVKKDCLRFLSVSSVAYWHGIDRFVKSMEIYYKSKNPKYNIYFYIVGPENQVRKDLEDYVLSTKEIKDRILFLGEKKSIELREIYLDVDFGVGSLGRHRSGIYDLNSLKNKEYCSYGIPFIYSENDKDFDGKPFALKVKPDESTLDIDYLCDNLVDINLTRSDIVKYAHNYTWDTQMKKIFSFFVG